MSGQREEVKTQVYKASDFYPQHDFNIARETDRELEGLIGTFAKPSGAQAQHLVPSLQFTNATQSNQRQLMHGEVPVDREFNFS